MKKRMNRRTFIKKSAAIGASSIIGASILPGRSEKTSPVFKARTGVDVAVAQGEDYFKNAVHAVRELGGMGAFVPKGAKVAILANPQSINPGAFTNPEIVRAAIQMCKEAGAGEIACITQLSEKNWKNTGLTRVTEEEGVAIIRADRNDDPSFETIPIPGGIALKEARIMKALYDYDCLIDIPVTKDHAGNKFTGTMKNLMGLNSGKSNRTFHKDDWKTNPDSIEFLEQCIADLNTVITPDLCIVDATEFIITNGPFGPGEIIKPKKVIAGTDRVAMDSYCCTLWGLNPEDIIIIQKAYAHKLGERDAGKVMVKEITV